MTRLDTRLGALRSAGRKALVPFVTAGDPSLAATVPVMASSQVLLSSLRNWLHSSSGPTISMISEIPRSSRFVPATSSEWVTERRLASRASRVA